MNNYFITAFIITIIILLLVGGCYNIFLVCSKFFEKNGKVDLKMHVSLSLSKICVRGIRIKGKIKILILDSANLPSRAL